MVTTPTSTVLHALASLASTSSTVCANPAPPVLSSMVPNAPQLRRYQPSLVDPTKSFPTESASATQDSTLSMAAASHALPILPGTVNSVSVDVIHQPGASDNPSVSGTATTKSATVKADIPESTASALRLDFMMDNLFLYFSHFTSSS